LTERIFVSINNQSAVRIAQRSEADAQNRHDRLDLIVAARRTGRYRCSMQGENPLDNVIVVTTNDLPGYEVVQVLGEVFGLVVRARNVFSNLGASLRTIFGGEVTQYTQLLGDSRNQAIERLRLAAQERGGNAVLAMRFDCNEIADLMSEIAAYGTAAIVRKR
jgi:uncharacterized protein YbjQ (UPF0145 family)